MSGPAHFAKIAIPAEAVDRAIEEMAKIAGADWRETRGSAAWAGLAAEDALVEAYKPTFAGEDMYIAPAGVYAYDLELHGPGGHYTAEVKTRAVDSGWTDPSRFEWLTIPTHDGREPIKDVDFVFFCWYSGDEPRELWVLGYLKGREEFMRRSHFYRADQPLPRGGWAPKGGAYCIEVKQLRPLPRGMFREVDK